MGEQRGDTGATLHVLCLVGKRRRDGFSAHKCTVQGIKGVKAMLWGADTVLLAGGGRGHGGWERLPYRANSDGQLTPVGRLQYLWYIKR